MEVSGPNSAVLKLKTKLNRSNFLEEFSLKNALRTRSVPMKFEIVLAKNKQSMMCKFPSRLKFQQADNAKKYLFVLKLHKRAICTAKIKNPDFFIVNSFILFFLRLLSFLFNEIIENKFSTRNSD